MMEGMQNSTVTLEDILPISLKGKYTLGFPKWLSSKESACQCRRCQRHKVQSLDWEDPLEEEMATHSFILAWRIHGQRSLVGFSLWGHKESDTTE